MIRKDFKYKLIKNFLTKEEIKLLTDYCRIKHRINFDSFDYQQNDNGDTFLFHMNENPELTNRDNFGIVRI